jgi:hypothetical protein
MRFMMLLKADKDTEAGVLPTKELLLGMGNLMEDMAKAGVLISGEGLKPSSEGKRLSMAGGKVTKVTDGPFAETKELIAGFCLLQVDSWDDALKWCDRFAAVAGHGESEVRPLFEVTDFPADIFPPEAAAREEELRQELLKKAATS